MIGDASSSHASATAVEDVATGAWTTEAVDLAAGAAALQDEFGSTVAAALAMQADVAADFELKADDDGIVRPKTEAEVFKIRSDRRAASNFSEDCMNWLDTRIDSPFYHQDTVTTGIK